MRICISLVIAFASILFSFQSHAVDWSVLGGIGRGLMDANRINQESEYVRLETQRLEIENRRQQSDMEFAMRERDRRGWDDAIAMFSSIHPEYQDDNSLSDKLISIATKKRYESCKNECLAKERIGIIND